MARVQIFLSTVSAEFRSYRDALRHDLTRPNVSVAVQEDFIVTGTETLDMLDDYIRQCDAVIHLVGDMTGALTQEPSLAMIRQRYPNLGEKLPPLAPFLKPGAPTLSYTQWEAWLALYHGKPLVIAVPEEGAPRDKRVALIPEQRDAQQTHLQRLAEVERYPGIRFASPDRLAVDVLRSKLQEIIESAGPLTRPANLPFLSLGELFKGREATLDKLVRSLGPIPDNNETPVAAQVVNGLGGVGKTRLAIEYAWRHAEDYRALLFVMADSGEALQRNLAALCTLGILDLPERQEKEEAKQYEAVLRWLKQHPGWLLILDNVDSKPAGTAVEALLPKLTGGHVLLTSRLADWSVSLAPVGLDVLAPEAAVDFLLARTDAKRRKQTDDAVIAQRLTNELGCLALALEQAGAYIAQRRLNFDRYLTEWQSQRDKVLTWFDARLMQYPKSVAITWQTSVDQLSESARQLLQCLAWLAPDPIPESLLDVPMPESETPIANLFDALAELESYSLITRAVDRPSFTVHRLVQEVTRRKEHDESKHAMLTESLHWINTAFTGDPSNPDDWPVLSPLLTHVLAVSAYADETGITEPTALLMNQAGLLLHAKAQYTEAEPLFQRALAINEQALGPTHPDVATSLNNLALLHNAQGAYAQAEPLYQRALAVSLVSLGSEHPTTRTILENYMSLLQSMGKAETEIIDAIQSLKQQHMHEAP
ncbi:MAG TPA: tetratricopeptide repeat protein [Nitrospira sp.]|nr:tetratricopeptide repeat protein [Nitrospira sp.]